MAKRNAAKRRAVQAEDFTDLKLDAMGYRRVQVVGQNRVDAPRKRVSRALKWTFLTEAQRGAIERYADLCEESQVSVPGCLTPKQGSPGGTHGPQRICEQRSARTFVERRCSPTALAVLREALDPENPNDLDAFALAKYGPPRAAARLTVHGTITAAARDLAAVFGA